MKKIIVIMLIISSIIMLPSCEKPQQEVLGLDQENSCFMGFEVENNFVYLECWLYITNMRNKDLEFTISADFTEDVELGLLKNPILYACDELNNKQIFTIKAGAAENFKCTFVGEYAGVYQRHDRMLPEDITFHVN